MIQCNTNHCVFSRLFPFHQYSQSGRGNSPLPGCWVAGPARWPGPQAGGPCARQHDGPYCAPCADGQPHGPSHTHPGKRQLYGSVETCETEWMRNDKKNKKTTTTRKPTSNVAVTWGKKNTHVHVNTVLHYTKLRCLHWAVEHTKSNTPSVIVNHQYLAYFLRFHTADQSWHPSCSSNNPTEVGILVDILFIYYSHH